MEVILGKDIPKVGRIGDVVRVREGFARNFLLPNKMAYPATPANLKRIAQQRAKLVAEQAQVRKDADALAEKLGKLSCTVIVEVNDLDRLYGSVADTDIVKALEVEGYQIDKKAIVLEKPIEELGIFEVGIKLHPEVTAKIRLWVAKK
jgi:large subunit ribosomal protein L9